ncbi:transglutaminase-like superfamily protein [Terrimicrobium sacchariphilum]|uniref:Transglutaminase-like superfamily protein n=1 Tax=Terrimicrobium sacchariphilum TaxID=690879 RepID=A0A146G731_TERSA|nr:DUF3857 and transglutaminase domain-containing protein [Terrimicrobium sacchariphilum]GAT33525.1 transglutaminase-like superfamily protein [Terrimicrobium sacchariphilum]
MKAGRKGIALWSIVCLLAFSHPVSAETPSEEQAVRKGPAPAWAQPEKVPPPVDKKERNGSRVWLLQDEQNNAAEQTSYHHYARQFSTKSSVENDSSITILVDPTYQHLVLNKLVIHRDGKEIDRLPDQEIRTLHREEQLDRNMFDGQLSVIMVLNDIRVGDVVEYAFTYEGENPIFGGKFMDSFGTIGDEPVSSLHYRLLWPRDRTLQVRSHNSDLAPTQNTLSDGTTEYRWTASNVRPLIPDDTLPDWYDPWGWVQLSEWKSWSDVARWGAPLYNTSEELPDEIKQEVARIRTLPKPEDQIRAALWYVQDNIRYLGIEIGPNAHKPHALSEIVSRRFGDCKDKAVLLCAMLRDLGFQADPALVTTEGWLKHDNWLPSAWAFNHVVVHLSLDGKTYWLDPTEDNQGGALGDIYFPDYHQALVLRDDTTDLTEIKAGGYDKTVTDVKENYDFPDFSGLVNLSVETVYRGHAADVMRRNLENYSQEEITKNYRSFYGRDHENIQSVEVPEFTDDRSRNIITCREKYVIRDFWKNDDDEDHLKGKVDADIVSQRLSRPESSSREMPYALDYPARVNSVIELSFPRSMNFDSDSETVNDPSFHYSFTATPDGSRLTLRHKYEAKADHVPSYRMSGYLSNLDRAYGSTGYMITVPHSWTKGGTQEESEEVKTPPRSSPAWKTSAVIILAAGAAGLLMGSLFLLLFAVLAFRMHRRAKPVPASPFQPPGNRPPGT